MDVQQSIECDRERCTQSVNIGWRRKETVAENDGKKDREMREFYIIQMQRLVGRFEYTLILKYRVFMYISLGILSWRNRKIPHTTETSRLMRSFGEFVQTLHIQHLTTTTAYTLVSSFLLLLHYQILTRARDYTCTHLNVNLHICIYIQTYFLLITNSVVDLVN